MRASFVIPVGPNEVGISRRAIELRRRLEAGAGGDSAEFLLVISYVTVNGSALRAVVIGDVLDAEGRAVAP
ncbi:MAG: hypothetical protein ACP5ID_07105, partial [Conexivisphaera sp.]